MKKAKRKTVSPVNNDASSKNVVTNGHAEVPNNSTLSKARNHSAPSVGNNRNMVLERRGSKKTKKSLSRFNLLTILSGLTVVFAVVIGIWYNISVVYEEDNVQFSGDMSMILDSATELLSRSLNQAYMLDSARVQVVREHNMKFYDFDYNMTGIDRRRNLSLQEFYDVYDGKWPVIIQDVIPNWEAATWTHESLCSTYEHERIVIKAVNGLMENAESLAMPLGFFCNHTHMANEQLWTYLEDELFIPMRPWLRKDVGPTVYWEDDLFQEFPSEVRPWNCMLLWGTAYSRSSMHMDPYNWTGTNAVLRGHKHWTLVPPGQDHLMYVHPGKRSEFPLNCFKYNSAVDSFNYDEKRFPKFKSAKVIQFDQHPGELLIIPTGWFHQAYNSEETIAVSSQFVNRNNYRVVLEEILKFGDVSRSSLSSRLSKLSPAEQVKGVMSILPAELLTKGRQITNDILEQIKYKKNSPSS